MRAKYDYIYDYEGRVSNGKTSFFIRGGGGMICPPPGVLSGEKQRIGRDYDFASVISWFAER